MLVDTRANRLIPLRWRNFELQVTLLVPPSLPKLNSRLLLFRPNGEPIHRPMHFQKIHRALWEIWNPIGLSSGPEACARIIVSSHAVASYRVPFALAESLQSVINKPV